MKECCENCKYLISRTNQISLFVRGLCISKHCKLLRIQLENTNNTICDKFELFEKLKDRRQSLKQKYNFRDIE